MRILYVEDNATNVILVQRVANMGKHEVITYSDGQDALDHFQQDKPNLVLLDVQLRGGLTGLDVAHTLRMKGVTVPIIAVTAYAMKGDRQRCLDAGCDDYLPKPISVAELVTVFKRYGDAVVAGKPILSTFKFQPPAAHAPAQPTSPAHIALTLVAAPVASESPAAQLAAASPEGTSSIAPPPAVEKTPPPVVNVVPAAVPTTAAEPVALTPSSDPLAKRAPTPMSAEP